jgi:hypothetical protein
MRKIENDRVNSIRIKVKMKFELVIYEKYF